MTIKQQEKIISDPSRQRWIWEVSVCGQDWDEQIYLDEKDAIEALLEYFEFRETEGDVDMSPMFRKLRIKNFQWVCPDHGTALSKKDGEKYFCEKCKDDGYDGYLDIIEPRYNRVREGDYED